jgi:outer membrane receptor protein involved in Fe transport
MRFQTGALGAAAIALVSTTISHSAFAADTSGIETVVVTAQKINQNINDVGMSIQAASGDQLRNLGVTDTADLVKIVPGFNYTPSFYGTPIYTIRGVGFLDTSLAASPTVSVYVDQMPLPYSIMTTGASLDIERVEILKGPQGTLFGENATGGAINYIAQKPTDTWQAGADASYGRFNTADLQGFVSGPIADTLSFRVAARTIQSNDWQYSYTHPDTWGAKNVWEARASLLWEPINDFKALLTVSGFQDRSDTQMPQLYSIAILSPASGLDPRIFNYPRAPHDPQAADWSACVNSSPFDPPFDTTPIGEPHPVTSTECVPARNNNRLFNVSLRMDYNVTSDIILTSLSAHERFDRYSAIEGDGTIFQDYESIQRGFIDVTYEELRLSGNFAGQGNWIVGGNYEKDSTYDNFLQTYGGSTANPTAIPGAILCFALDCTGVDLTGVPLYYLTTLGPTQPVNRQHTQIMAIFANGEYPILDDLTLQAGIRFTQTNKSFHGCGNDGGDGTWATVSQQIQNLLELLNGFITPATYLQPGAAPGGNGVNLGPGSCSTSGPPPTFHPQFFTDFLNENNVSWRTGLNWKVDENTLLYFNVSRGWKAGSYPTVATSAFTQLAPARQEGLLAYELGAKATMFDNTLQLNGAFFYYDYKDKQLLGAIVDPVFGPLPALVNVPESHIVGFEFSADWTPIPGLTLRPNVSYVHSRVDGCSPEGPNCIDGDYYNFDPFSQFVNLTGEAFPASPQWQMDLDAQYEWLIGGDMTAFVGANVNYQAKTDGFFINRAPFPDENVQPPHVLYIPRRTLLDLRAGVETGAWRAQIWGRNVLNDYYWTGASHVNDVLYRYAGMPVTYGVTLSYRFQ